MFKILPSVIGSVVGLALGIAILSSSVHTLSAWARIFQHLLNCCDILLFLGLMFGDVH